MSDAGDTPYIAKAGADGALADFDHDGRSVPRLPAFKPTGPAPLVSHLESAAAVAEDNDPDLLDRLQWRAEKAARQAQQLAAAEASAVIEPPVPKPLVASNQRVAETLAHMDLDFLGVAEPLRPTRQVVFTLDGVGMWSVKFHHVVVTKKLVVLVYDNRYNQGVQFLPAASNHPIQVRIADLNVEFECVSLDLAWVMGCLDCVALIVSQPN